MLMPVHIVEDLLINFVCKDPVFDWVDTVVRSKVVGMDYRSKDQKMDFLMGKKDPWSMNYFEENVKNRGIFKVTVNFP